MRKSFTHKVGAAGAPRRGPARIPSRALACLVGLLLALNVVGLHRHQAAAAPQVTAKAAALASLSAAIGQPATICEHGDGAPLPGDRDGSAGCEHCPFCHSVAAGVLPPAGVAPRVDRVAILAEIARSREQAPVARRRASGSATPRGPPALG